MSVVFTFHFYTLNCAYYTIELALVLKIPRGMTIYKTIALKIPLIPLKQKKHLLCQAPLFNTCIKNERSTEYPTS